MSHFSTSVVLKCHTLFFCSVQSKDWLVHFSNYSQQCPHTNKQKATELLLSSVTFEQFWGRFATVLFSLLNCSPLFQPLREIQFQKRPQAGSDKRIIYNSTQLPGFKNLQQQQKKTWLVLHQLNIYNYKTNTKLPQGKKLSSFLVCFALLAIIFISFFLSKFALRVEKKPENTVTVMWSFL